MKKFEDLEFNPHPVMSGLQARMTFENGFGVSVVRFKLGSPDPLADFTVGFCAKNDTYGSYTDNEDEWEVAVLKDGELCYSSGITDDVVGNCTENEVTKIMKQAQLL